MPQLLKFIGAALLTFAGGLLCFACLYYAQQYRILRDWPQAQATVIESRVVERPTNDGPLYVTEVRFAFAVDGKPVVGDFTFPHASTNATRKQKQAAQYAEGSRHTIAYDPADPSSVRVRPGYNVEFFVVPVFLTGLAAMFAGVGGGLWWLGRVGAKRALRAAA